MQRNREVPAVELSLQRLQRDAKVNDDLLTLLKTRHQEALIKESEGVEEVTHRAAGHRAGGARSAARRSTRSWSARCSG